jgi:hypothetical protein
MGQNLLVGPDSTSGFGGAVSGPFPVLHGAIGAISLSIREIFAPIAPDAVLVFAAVQYLFCSGS